MPYLTTEGLVLKKAFATDPFQPSSDSLAAGALETKKIPIDLPTTTYQALYRVVLGPVSPGDVLDVTAAARVTNDAGYVVGVGWHLWLYDYSNPARSAGPWRRISALDGQNCPPDTHHLSIKAACLYPMPDDWPTGHRPVVVLRADAHSTAWQPGDTLTADAGYGQLIVRHWAPP
ncbi:hypothetical protein ACIQPQ_34285 [Streptomyces sp. NPDC091281]|uniref:hypothetical protein n=1 Tax=Streptomyces sp. NPDC091281 TaxID=3365985 RepID=UPI003801785C